MTLSFPPLSTTAPAPIPPTGPREAGTGTAKLNIPDIAHTIAQMANGVKIRKAALDPDKTRWAYELVRNMKSVGALNENPQEYFISNSYAAKGVTKHSPAPYKILEYKGALKNDFDKMGIRNALVFGWRGRKFELNSARQDLDKADFLVLPAIGDLYSVHRFLQFVNKPGTKGAAKEPKVLIIENPNGHYNPLLAGMFGEPDGRETATNFYESKLQQMLQDRHITVKFSYGPDHTRDLCLKAQRDISAQHTSFNKVARKKTYSTPLVQTIFVASTSDKKLAEAKMLFPRQHVTSLQDLIGVFPEATEKHITYEGNAIGVDGPENSGKAYTMIKHLEGILNDPKEAGKKQMLLKKMERLGMNVNKPINIYLDDRGVEFPEELFPYFDHTNTENIEKDKYKPKPGVETTYYVQAKGGVEAFAEAFNAAYDAADEAYFAGKERVQIPRTAKQVCVSVLLRYNLGTQKYEIISGWGDSQSEFLKKPRRGNDKALDEHHWMVPRDAPNPESLSGGELGTRNYVMNYSAQGRAAQVLKELVRADQVKINQENQRLQDYKISYAGSGGPVTETKSPGMARLLSAHSVEVKRLKRSADESSNPARGQIGMGLQGFNQWIEGKDAVIFNSHHGLSKSELAFQLISTAVAKQLDPRCRDMLLAVDRSDPNLDRLCQILNLGNEVGYIKEKASTLFEGFYSENKETDELANLKASHMADYRRNELAVELLDKVSDDFVDLRSELNTGRPAAFICCSAGSNKTQDDNEVFATVEDLCAKGHDIYYGGGDKFMMGQVLNAVNAWNDLCNSGTDPELGPERAVKIVGISTPGIAARETAHGMPEGIKSHMCETIHGRMLNLIGNSDRLVALNGGAGTVQEILAFAKMKEENNPNTVGKSMTVINNEVVPGKPRLYESLLEFYGDGDREAGRKALKEMDIHVEDGIQAKSRKLQAHPTELAA